MTKQYQQIFGLLLVFGFICFLSGGHAADSFLYDSDGGSFAAPNQRSYGYTPPRNDGGSYARPSDEDGSYRKDDKADWLPKHKRSKRFNSEEILITARNYINSRSASLNRFIIINEETGQRRNISFLKMYDRVKRVTNDYFEVRADFKDEDTDKVIEVTLVIVAQTGVLLVEEVKVKE